MIVIRKFKNSDLEDLKELLEEVNIKAEDANLDDLVYLSFVDQKLIGVIRAKQKQDIWVLNYVYISKKWRNKKMGDALLRVVIDKLDRKEVKRLYFPEIDKYLIKNGFQKNSDNILELDVEGFFENKCCCGDLNEI